MGQYESRYIYLVNMNLDIEMNIDGYFEGKFIPGVSKSIGV